MNRGQGRSSNSRPFRGVRLRGLFADGIWQCDCDPRLPASHFRVKREGRNHGRWFYTCQKAENQRCSFFLWDDEANVREEGAILNNSRTEPRSTAQALENRHDAVNEQPRIPGLPTMGQRSPPQYSTQDPVSRRRGVNGNQSDSFDDDADDWTIDGAEIRRLETDAANQFRPQNGIPAPRTPIKRSHSDMNGTGLPTPQTDTRTRSGEASTSKRRATDAEFLNLVSPATTPTPMRFRDALTGGSDDALFSEVQQALITHGVTLHLEAAAAVRDICNRSSLRLQGVIKGYVC